MNKKTIPLSLIVLIFTCLSCQEKESIYVSPPLGNVTFKTGFWSRCTSQNAKVTVPYCVERCTESGCLHNFQLAAGQINGDYLSDNTWLDSDMYKALEAAFYSLMKYPDERLLQKTDSIVDTIISAQEKDGYLYTARTTHASHPRVVKFMGEERWTNMGHFSHELYNMGHMIEAAVAHYELTGNNRFLNVAIKAADLIVATFGEGKLTYPPGHQEIELALIKLYKLTNNTSYLEMASYFLEARGKYAERPPYTDEFFKEYHQDHLPVSDQREAVGHAVRAVYMYAAMADIVALTNNEKYKLALDSIWNDVMEKKIYITSGIGNQQLGEAFGLPYHLDNLKAYTETCAAIGLVYWAERMFAFDQDSKYYDVIERATYNGILSGISQDGSHFYYKNPLESKGNKKRTEWNSCACCPPNLARYIASMGSRVYGVKNDRLYVNMYAENQADMEVNGTNVHLLQETDYPWEGDVRLTINPDKKQTFSVYLRIPGWCLNQPLPGTLYRVYERDKMNECPNVWVNGEEIDYQIEKGYIRINRKWSKGDVVRLELLMQPQRIVSHPAVLQNENCAALTYGPFVYCAEEIDNVTDWDKLELSLSEPFSCYSMTTDFSIVPKMPVLSQNDELKLIPYFLWANRDTCKMKVWIPVRKE